MGLKDRIAERRFRRRIVREVHPERFASYGEGALVHPPLEVHEPGRITIGAGTYILAGARIACAPSGTVTIGARTYLGRDLTIVCAGEVFIGDDVMGSDRLLFADTAADPRDPAAPVALQPPADPRPVRIGNGVFLGTGAMVLAGVEVGEGTLIGAGAVLTASVPPNCVVGGNPARVIRHFDRGRGDWVAGPPPAA